MNDVAPNPDIPASVAPGQVTTATPTITVDPSKLKAIAIATGLALTATIGGSTTLLHFAMKGDLAGIVSFTQSSDSVPFFSGVAFLAGMGGLALRAARRKAREVYLAYHVRDRIAVVTGSIAPPAPPPAA